MMKCDTVSSVLFLGDSIAKGVMLDEDRNRYVFLQQPFAQHVAELFGIDLENRARFGSTIAKGREQWEKWLEKGKQAEVVLLEFGGNDCDFHWDEVGHDPVPEHHIPNTELASFVLQYTDLVRDIQQHGLQPVMMTLPPIDAERYFAWITSPEKVDDQGVLAFLGMWSTSIAGTSPIRWQSGRWPSKPIARSSTCDPSFSKPGITAGCCVKTASIPMSRAMKLWRMRCRILPGPMGCPPAAARLTFGPRCGIIMGAPAPVAQSDRASAS